MTRSLVPLLALFALACGSQDAAPPADAPAAEPAATEEAPPDRTATEAADAEAVKKLGAATQELPSFEGDHAMAKTDAVRVSLEWLALVDGGDYAAGWEAAASLMQDAAPKEQFGQGVGAAREPLGAVTSRSFSKAEYATALPGAPDGEYVVIQYETVFENKAQAVETITPMLDWDGMWKVSGYYVK
jgi:hypothetical protein